MARTSITRTGLTRLQTSAELVPATPWREVIEAFLAAHADSENTKRAYRRHLESAFGALACSSLVELTGGQLAAYRAALVEDGRGPASHSQALAALRSFLMWAGRFGAHAIPADALRAALRTPRTDVRRPYTVLSESELASLLAATTTARDRALVALMAGAGLRVAEVVALDPRDLREDVEGGAAVYVRSGKGRRDRLVPIGPEVAQLVRAYLAATGRSLSSPGPLFRAHDRGAETRHLSRLTTRAAASVVAVAVARAGIAGKAVSPHALRHTYAIRALRNGGNVAAVRKLLGHASLTTTQRYLDHLELRELRAVVPALPCYRPRQER